MCSGQSEFLALLWFLVCRLFEVLYLSLVVNFLFFNFPDTTFGLDLFAGACLNKLCF